jgi:TolB protein
VVYSSYLGGQWHQLWLMTSEGENPFQLTYGDFDAVAPRWAPDGRQIAYISNEGGNTSLWIAEVPGGRRERVAVERRIYRGPVGRLRILVSDSGTRRPMPARVSVLGLDGRSYAPDDTWRYAEDGFDRRERKFEYQYFQTLGASTVTLPTGAVEVEVSRGPEYRVESRSIQVREGDQVLRVSLRRLADLPGRGWYGGDLHVHVSGRPRTLDTSSPGSIGWCRRCSAPLIGIAKPRSRVLRRCFEPPGPNLSGEQLINSTVTRVRERNS